MSKSPPHNGPSKTGNPSGGGRGNNAPRGDEDESADCSPQHRAFLDRRHSDHVGPARVRADGAEDRARRLHAALEKTVQSEIEKVRTTKDPSIQSRLRLYPTDEPTTMMDRIEKMGMFLRTLRECEAPGYVETMEARLRASLTAHQNALLTGRIRQKPGVVSERVRARLSVSDWIAYFSNSVET